MKIIMPMAGSGKRFADEGYSEIKPIIQIGGKAMVAHACDSFPNNADSDIEFIFICNKEHIDTTNLGDVLKSVRSNSKIVSIAPDNGGPVTSVLLAEKEIPDDEEVIINYCDFAMEWDYDRFIDEMHAKKADGGIPAFRGFQPAQFTGTKYAYLRLDNVGGSETKPAQGLRVLEIREKESFTNNKLSEFASTGTYYFRTGALMKKYFHKAVEFNLRAGPGSEFYASLPFNPMI
ncbi:TPA: NTP transferase domain-containing protein, partial [Candidatus Micrarchaeota archaeon]|nr:NTP transferase domain-containing protein [Candidatus Micrarchaeota archaeon]